VSRTIRRETEQTVLPSVELLIFKYVVDEEYVARNEDNEPQQAANRPRGAIGLLQHSLHIAQQTL